MFNDTIPDNRNRGQIDAALEVLKVSQDRETIVDEKGFSARYKLIIPEVRGHFL